MKFHILIITLCLLLISCSEKREKITNISQLTDKRICVLTGSAGDIAAKSTFPNAKFFDMVALADAALAIKTGKADAFIYDKSILLQIVEKNSDLIILNERVAQLEVAAALNKQNSQLLSQINNALSKLKDKGILDELRKKWVDSRYVTTPTLQAKNNNGTNGILKLGTYAVLEPFSFYSNGKFTGLDIELGFLIGELLGKKIEIYDMNFEGLIPALHSGKIDFALANFNVTEERKKLISFSTPYIGNDISVLVKK
jgi:polar amino acid transport system substrate-binding protein